MNENSSSRARVRDHRTSSARAALDAAFAGLDLAGLGWARAARSAPVELLHRHPAAVPARVVRVDRGRMLLVAEGGAPPRHVRDRTDEPDPPVVGDWVLVERPPRGADGLGAARVRLPRSGVIARRRDTASDAPQALAANVDVVLVAEALADGREPNLGRIARFVALARAADVDAVVLLTHADRVPDPGRVPAHVDDVAAIATSIVDGRGLDELRDALGAGTTAMVVGASGAGKSSLVNALRGDELQAVTTQRSSGTGRHTTSTSQLVPLPSGALLADTPGIRSVGMHAGVGVGSITPQAIARLADGCRFGDCRHDGEPGCAVAAAVERGDLEPDALATWRKLEREALRERARADDRLRRELAAERLALSKRYERARRRGEIPNKRR